MIKQNAAMAYEFLPQGGELYVQSSLGYDTINTTSTSPAITNATIGTDTTSNTVTPTSIPGQSTSP